MQESYFPKRIVCLTEEVTEVLYLLGEDARIVGISAYTVRPKKARKEKPIIGRFIDAKIDDIIALKPDLVIGFSDIQASIAQELIAKGLTVWINNYRTIEGIYNMIAQLGALVGRQEDAIALISTYKKQAEQITQLNRKAKHKPLIYFEEWYDPLISGITWVNELISLAGGIDIFNDNKNTSLAKDRIIKDNAIIIERNPDIIIASWCGKKFRKEQLLARDGWQAINAVKNDFIYEIKSELILQPGPAAITDGLQAITMIISHWHEKKAKL